MTAKFLTIQTVILLLISAFVFAQEDLKDKLKNIEGEVNKIVVTTDKGEFTFEGDEAETLFKRMNSKKHNIIKWISEDDDDFSMDVDGKNVMVFKSDKGDKHIIKKVIGDDDIMFIEHSDIDDIDIIKDGKKIKVEVNEDDGEKKVTVTTEENGEKKIETYEGEEADEYLEKLEKEHEVFIDVEVETDSDGEHVWIHKNGNKTSEIEKKVKVEVVDGVKKVTVTTIEDGEEKVEVYEGDEANKFLDEDGATMKKMKKKIIIK